MLILANAEVIGKCGQEYICVWAGIYMCVCVCMCMYVYICICLCPCV